MTNLFAIIYLLIKSLLTNNKYIKMLPFIILLLILNSYINLNSKPCGYMSSTTVTIMVNGCEYDVKICFDCAFTHPNENSIFISEYNKKPWWCNQTWPYQKVHEEIEEQIYNWDFLKQYICLDADLEPCEKQIGVIEFKISRTICWQKQKRDDLIYFQPCIENQSTCIETWRYCYSNLPPIGPTRTFIGSEGEIGECPTPINIPPDPINELEISDCFRLSTTKCDE
ncbi:hypothetical protein MASR1M45_04540 [Candidatus Kapaibacterium sp.]